MAVGWALRKVFKGEHGSSSSRGALEIEGSSVAADQDCCPSCLSNSTVRWVLTVVLGLQLFVFALLSLPMIHGRHHAGKATPYHDAAFVATFKLQRPANVVSIYQSDLERNISNHFAHLKMKVMLMNVSEVSQGAQVEFALYPVPANRTLSNKEVGEIREHLVTLFMQRKNLSLVPTTFGKVYDFQIDRLKGGVTIVPKQPYESLSRRSPLFNFTLHNATLDSVNEIHDLFRCQLAQGINLHHKENLITRLTNINGSTTEPPVIVQAAVFREGQKLDKRRLRQLALRVSRHKKNLGLNRTLFGKVQDVHLSPVLHHYLPYFAQAPGPSPEQAPGPSPTSPYTYYSTPLWHQGAVVRVPAPEPSSDPFSSGVDFTQVSRDSPRKQARGGSSAAPAFSPLPSAGVRVMRGLLWEETAVVLVASAAAALVWF